MLEQPRNRGIFVVGLIVVLAAGTTAWWLTGSGPQSGPLTGLGDDQSIGRGDAEDTSAGDESEGDRRHPSVHVAASDEPGTESDGTGNPNQTNRGPGALTAVPSPHWTVYAAKSRRVVALFVLASRPANGTRAEPGASGRTQFCVPASFLPTDQGLTTEDGAALQFEAITWERGSDLVLLTGLRPLPAPARLAPAAPRDPATVRGDEPLRAVSVGGRNLGDVHLVRIGSVLEFDRPLPNGAAVLDRDGHVVAYGTDAGGHAIHALAPWRDWWKGRPLEEIQAEIRAADPRTILADARKWLDSGAATLESAERAVELLTRGQHLARDRETMDALDRMLRFGHQQRVRILSETNGIRALQQAKKSLDVLGSDPDILSDATELALDHGDANEALGMFQNLLATSADHAKKIRGTVGDKINHKASVMLRGRRNQEAFSLLATAVLNLPERADLRMLYARAASEIGDSVTAQLQADEAARRDPSYLDEARRYASAARRSQGNRTGRGNRRGRRAIEIPFPRGASSVTTSGKIGTAEIGFIVDTGASYTTIPHAVAQNLGLLHAKTRKVKVTTASGVEHVPHVVVPSVTIDGRNGRITVRKVTVMVMDLPGGLAGKSLLGLDVLSKLNLRIDSDRSVIELSQSRRNRR